MHEAARTEPACDDVGAGAVPAAPCAGTTLWHRYAHDPRSGS